MKKLNKKDYINILILSAIFLFFVLIRVHCKFYYGSTLDWYEQHIAFPEYFRDLFYKTKNLFPDFAFNIGAGQNIYNFSYYGLLSPYIILSYALPFMEMVDYIVIITVISVIVGSAMLYIWLRKKGNSSLNCFICSLFFLFATSVSLHSHRHIMFINYMPFLILGLFGVDRKLDKNRNCMLAIAVFLMIMTSYYYSIGGIFTLIIYGVYKYLKDHKEVTFKQFMADGVKFVLPILLGVLMASVIILPTFKVILSGRGETYNTIGLKDIFMPNIYLENYLYEPYGVGLSTIIILAIISLFDHKKENIFLGIVLSLLLVFPFFNYILNATMYIDSKTLIPLLPICLFALSLSLNKIFNKEIDYKKILPIFVIVILIGLISCSRKLVLILDLALTLGAIVLYKKFNKKYLLLIPISLFMIGTSCYMSFKTDNLMNKEKTDKEYNAALEIVNEITDTDDTYYRTNLDFGSIVDNRAFHNSKYYSTTIYSSTYNMNYNEFFYDTINNNFLHRNKVMTSASANIMSNIFTSSKYFVSKSKRERQGYEYVDKIDGYYIFKNENVLPIAYASSNVLSYDDYNSLGYPNQSEALIKTIVADTTSTTNFKSDLQEIPFDTKNFIVENLDIHKGDNNYIIKSSKRGTAKYLLPEEYQNKIIFIRFHLNESQACDIDDLLISINGIKNKLTCKEWKYHNQNYDFDYVISDKELKTLSIVFNEGTFNISDIKLYVLDYDKIANVGEYVDAMHITKMFDNTLEGTIKVTKDGYFTASIPYDDGFTAYIDGKKVEVEKVNTSFIGFPISSGNHEIKIVYESPLKKISMLISFSSLIVLIIVYILEAKKKI